MEVSVHALTVEQFSTTLTAFKGILQKGQDFCEAKKIDFSVLAQTRLAPDQFPLAKQIQIACDSAKFAVARLAGVQAPKHEDNESSFQDFQKRIESTLEFINTVSPSQFANYKQAVVRFPWYPGKHLTGGDYLIQHALPNFYFHVTTAYSILRSSGVELGKADYLGRQNWIVD